MSKKELKQAERNIKSILKLMEIAKEAGRKEVLKDIEDIIEDCVIIRIKNVPEHMAGIDLTWLDKEIFKIKQRLLKKLNGKNN